MFQHTAARRRLVGIIAKIAQNQACFNTQPPEGGWGTTKGGSSVRIVSTHSRPKAAGKRVETLNSEVIVSTHSRPKAAGSRIAAVSLPIPGFNTQPPEGGWLMYEIMGFGIYKPGFNTQPPEGGWA